MQTGFVRYNQLKESTHKKLTLPVIRYSVYENINKLLTDSKNLIRYVYKDSKDKIEMINSIVSDLEYSPNPIKLKESICEEFYKNEKYYLD